MFGPIPREIGERGLPGVEEIRPLKVAMEDADRDVARHHFEKQPANGGHQFHEPGLGCLFDEESEEKSQGFRQEVKIGRNLNTTELKE